ncbi:MAG: DUF4956 domain-containing protein [Bacteroidia bacterium]
MTRTLLNWLFPVLLLLLTPATHLSAQDSAAPVGENGLFVSSPETTETTDTDKEDKKKKKKDKEETEAEFFTFSLDRFDITFFTRLLVNLLSMIILVRFIYYPVYKKRDYFFTFFMFNVTIFVITFLLNTKSSFSTGAAFGLFAVFSLLRYRTEDISARDMTYLFTVIALGLISSVNKGNVLEIVIVNSTIILAAFLLDGNVLMKTEFVKTVQYENIDLIKSDNHTALIEDLKKRTGLNIHKISIGRVDFLRDTAVVKIYYYENRNQDV